MTTPMAASRARRALARATDGSDDVQDLVDQIEELLEQLERRLRDPRADALARADRQRRFERYTLDHRARNGIEL
jgi:hypothetical protein